jgi:MraZ protein
VTLSGKKWKKPGGAMFRGINAINLDSKGRMTLPTRCREDLQKKEDSSAGALILTIDTDSPCLLLYPMKEWQKIEEKIQALPSFNKATRRIQRLLIGHAAEVEVDASGRVLLPPLLREYANLEKEIVLVGQGNKFEVWDKKFWQKHRDEWLAEEADDTKGVPPELETLAL